MSDISIQIGPTRHRSGLHCIRDMWLRGGISHSSISLALGGVVTKTITMLPRKGNLPPRIHELPHGMLNSIGLENVGLDRYLSEKFRN